MQTWAAVSIIIGQVIICLVLWKIMRTFGQYTDALTSTHQQNLKIRENMAIAENDRAIALLMHRRHDDPQPNEEIA